MGLFSNVIHLWEVDQSSALAALDQCLARFGFVRSACLDVPEDGPSRLTDHEHWPGPYYLMSDKNERWLTVIEVSQGKDGPYLGDLCTALSAEGSCYCLALMVHDSDVFLYNLDHCGNSLDGYNSCPEYFDKEQLSAEDVESQRHAPDELQPILPEGVGLDPIIRVLNDGWWRSYDEGKRGEDLANAWAERFYTDEGDRMSEFGRLLELNGKNRGYPFALWAESQDLRWQGFKAVRYAKKKSLFWIFGA